jgi:PhnB protein
MNLQPTLYFQGVCDDAIKFYTEALDAEVLFRLPIGGHVPAQFVTPETAGKVMRAGLRIGRSIVYVSDGHCAGQPAFQGLSMSLAVDTRADAERYQQALAEGGRIQIPLQTNGWAETFGTAIDRFGLHWTIEVAAKHGQF